MNTELRKKAKNDFEKYFCKVMSNSTFRKTMENKQIKTETCKNRNYSMSESNYHITKFLTESVLVIEMRKTQIFTNKPVCLGLSILELSKIVMYEIWYEYIKPKYEDKAKLCYMDTKI